MDSELKQLECVIAFDNRTQTLRYRHTKSSHVTDFNQSHAWSFYSERTLNIIYIYIHLFQKTPSERTANGSCRTEIARPKGTVVSILMSSSRGAKLGSLSNHNDDSYTNPTNLHI